MLIRKEIVEKDCLIGIWEISETRTELLDMLSPENKEQAQRQLLGIKSKKRTLELLSTRVILQLLTNDNKTIDYTTQGEPFLSDQSYQISISHSNNHAVVLLHKSKKVGVDIENYSSRILNIEKRFMSEEEYIDPDNRTLHLMLHWCAKETLYKLMDSTEIIFKEHLHIHPFEVQNKGIIKAYESFTDNQINFNIYYEVTDDFVLAWGVM
ncbi:MAG: 4'-phosphopantetheinyl transferase superfamily protein [Dysgonamonadaceae bacterium]|jgi:4'-phosphopantetheinyl transferase EntD|nr:4'-phosphopantetheinyl transferase superfamily protein [Dysgonamonadaceae bacterium]MDD3356636.1 4'-phosphopantetheinyl transferase superfamily protein [Dysgonamonadaceae bacterium]MDD3727496.1 4'-phosphopantetheinyl transferase superfamily protein [Dysgonamonadaceae bacterium]MDD4246373.1 4'-phosphopantetheinyl transferase superfamily protein [Dysgonamonadaceae bacterium]HUI32336.1 4'-phosphopantetheinyl transferase superfamily protein [Dysgonamonadaceae bacterium]